MLVYSFFFSSRRRHTRWPRDWSSDVCSSDLTNPENANEESCDYVDQAALDAAFAAWVDAQTAALNVSGGCETQMSNSSEEVSSAVLRVGKNWTLTWTISDLYETTA